MVGADFFITLRHRRIEDSGHPIVRRGIRRELLFRLRLQKHARFHTVIRPAGEIQHRPVRARNGDFSVGHGHRSSRCRDTRLPLAENMVIKRGAAHDEPVAVGRDLSRPACAVSLADAVVAHKGDFKPYGK